MELKYNIKNTSKEDVALSWGRFTYTVKAGEAAFVPKNVFDAMTTRYGDKLSAYTQDDVKVEKVVEVSEEEDAVVVDMTKKPAKKKRTTKKTGGE